MKRIQIYKYGVVLVALCYAALSLFPWSEIRSMNFSMGEIFYTTDYPRNPSILIITAVLLQVALLLKGHRNLQLVFGLIGVIPGAIHPLKISVMKIVDDVIRIIGSSTQRDITTLGWVVTVVAWILLALDILITVAMKRHAVKTMPTTVDVVESDVDIQ